MEQTMQISSSRPAMAKTIPAPKADQAQPQKDDSSFGDSVRDFYESNKSAIHLGGGALLGAGIAMYGAGLSGGQVVSAAGSGALGGFFAGNNSKAALYMGGGALIGATIANMAGVPGTAVMSAAGTGALVGFLFT
jgi:hypothetical protein